MTNDHRGTGEPELTDRQRQFADHYTDTIRAAMAKDPAGWMDTHATAPRLAARMVIALTAGTALVSPQAKQAARRLGITPTKTAIRAWLREDGDA